jgi:hypothetical protein
MEFWAVFLRVGLIRFLLPILIPPTALHSLVIFIIQRCMVSELTSFEKKMLPSNRQLYITVSARVKGKFFLFQILLLRTEGSSYFRVPKNKCEEDDYEEFELLMILSRDWVTIDGVWIGDRIYCTLIQLVTPFHRWLYDILGLLSLLCLLVTDPNNVFCFRAHVLTGRRDCLTTNSLLQLSTLNWLTQSHFATGDLPPFSSSCRQAHWGSIPVFL